MVCSKLAFLGSVQTRATGRGRAENVMLSERPRTSPTRARARSPHTYLHPCIPATLPAEYTTRSTKKISGYDYQN